MSVTYATAVKTARMTALKDHFLNGTLEIRTAADLVLATFTLSATAGSVSGAVWTLGFVASTASATATGTATKAVIKTSGAAEDFTGLTVGTSGSDINVDNDSIASGQDVTLNSAQITHAV